MPATKQKTPLMRGTQVLVTLLMAPEEKALLAALAKDAGGAGLSSTVRRLIRQEAKRLDLLAEPPAELEPAQS